MKRYKGVTGFHATPFVFDSFEIRDEHEKHGKSEGAGIYISTSNYTNKYYHDYNRRDNLKKLNIDFHFENVGDFPFDSIISNEILSFIKYYCHTRKLDNETSFFIKTIMCKGGFYIHFYKFFKEALEEEINKMKSKSLETLINAKSGNVNVFQSSIFFSNCLEMALEKSEEKAKKKEILSFPPKTMQTLEKEGFFKKFDAHTNGKMYEIIEDLDTACKNYFDSKNENRKDDYKEIFFKSSFLKNIIQRINNQLEKRYKNIATNYLITILVDEGLNDKVIGFSDTYTINSLPPKVAKYLRDNKNILVELPSFKNNIVHERAFFNGIRKFQGKVALELVCDIEGYKKGDIEGYKPWKAAGLKILIKLGLRATRAYASIDFGGSISHDDKFNISDEDDEKPIEYNDAKSNWERDKIQYYYVVYSPKFMVIEGISRGKRLKFEPQTIGAYHKVLKRFDPNAFESEYSEKDIWRSGIDSYGDAHLRKMELKNIKNRNKERAYNMLSKGDMLSPDDEALIMGYLRVDDSFALNEKSTFELLVESIL